MRGDEEAGEGRGLRVEAEDESVGSRVPMTTTMVARVGLRFVTWNVWNDNVEVGVRMGAIGEILGRESADVVALQEVTDQTYGILMAQAWAQGIVDGFEGGRGRRLGGSPPGWKGARAVPERAAGAQGSESAAVRAGGARVAGPRRRRRTDAAALRLRWEGGTCCWGARTSSPSRAGRR